MISKYFENFDVKNDFSKEYISLWNGWLGREESHKLDSVTEAEWSNFNNLVKAVCEKYESYKFDIKHNTVEKITDPTIWLPSFEENMEFGESGFTKIIIPELEVVLNETWDFTYILYHKSNSAVKDLEPLIKHFNLFNFK